MLLTQKDNEKLGQIRLAVEGIQDENIRNLVLDFADFIDDMENKSDDLEHQILVTASRIVRTKEFPNEEMMNTKMIRNTLADAIMPDKKGNLPQENASC